MTIIHGDCIEVMSAMEPESVDAIVTDPPYGLEFMGKEWDRLGTEMGATGGPERGSVSDVQTSGRRVLRGDGAVAAPVLRTPGLHGPAEEGPLWSTDEGRGEHALATGRPSGRRGWDGMGPRPRYQAGLAAQEWHARWAEAAYRVAKPSAYLLAFGGTRTVHRMTVALEDAGWIIRDMLVWAYASGFPKSKASLKPAWEPIVMARKPGPLLMLAIDATRIPHAGADDLAESQGKNPGRDGETVTSGVYGADRPQQLVNVSGRWPANILLTDPIFDGGVEGVVGGGEANQGSGGTFARNASIDGPAEVIPLLGVPPAGYGDSGTYSRFFLVPKADRSDREPIYLPPKPAELRGLKHKPDEQVAKEREARRVNLHPTVKPTDLMRHLVRLVTPTGGTVLDPFLGSGTTGLAAEMEGFEWIGVEREAEYVAIAEARLNGTQRGLGLETA